MTWDREAVATRGLVLLVAYAAIRSIFCAASKTFWYDELCTVAIARQPSIAAIWNALEHAADSHPPTYYLVERFCDYLLPNPHIAFRLPSIIGFCCIVLCIFIFVKRRSGGMCALLCSALTLMTIFFDPYAVEARGYALMTAFVALALISYQRADTFKWAVLVAFSLMAAGAFQYYAIFALCPFGIAEAAFCWQNRRLRLGVWAALACGWFSVIAFWPLLAQLKKYYGANFWAKPSLTGTVGVFGWFLNSSSYWGIAIAATAFIGIVGIMISECGSKDSDFRGKDNLFHERALVLGLLMLPLAVFVGLKITHGGLTERYMMPAGLGIPLAAGCMLPRLDRRMLALFGILLSFGLAAQEASFWIHHRDHLGRVVSPAQEAEELVNEAGQKDLPVVVSDARDYLQLVYYGPSGWLTRVVGVVDSSNATLYSGSDSVDKQLLILRSYVPLHVYEFSDFEAKQPRFLLYSEGTMFDWWPNRLVHDGYVLRLVAIRQNRKVYIVSRKDESIKK